MDAGPHDRCPRREIERTSCLHVTSKRETVWEHSPTRRKYWETLQLNRGAPIYFQLRYRPSMLPGSHYSCGPSTCEPRTRHVAPLTGIRVGPSAWPPATRQGHLCLVRATRALPRGLSDTSHLEAVPRATSAPACHVSTYK